VDAKKVVEKLGEIGSETADRREFLKKAGKVAATVPAVALLLSANATPAEAYNRYGRGGKGGHKHGHAYGHAKSRGRSAFGHSHKKH
jgi:hypothetical protein